MFAQLLSVFGVSLGLLIIAALMVRRDANRRANLLLAGALFCSSGYLVSTAMIRTGFEDLPRLTTALAYGYFCAPPLLYGYVRELTSRSPGRRFIGSHMLFPAGLVVVATSGVIEALYVNAENLAGAQRGWPPSLLFTMSVAMYVVTVSYLLLSLATLRRHQAAVTEIFSFQEKVALNWLKRLLLAYLALSLLGFALSVVRMLPDVELWPRSYYSVLMLISVNYLIAFIGISQPMVFASSGDISARPAAVTAHTGVEKRVGRAEPDGYGGRALTADMARAYWAEVQQCMESEAPHLDAGLRVADLAERTGIPAHHLSQTINQCAGKNFFHFVNDYRVRTAQELLRQGDLPVKAITFDAGFNSQSAFYRHFKQVTGMTPRQYQLGLKSAGKPEEAPDEI